MLFLLADTGPSALDQIVNWTSGLGSLGFAVWYGYYVTTVTIPKIVAEFRDESRLNRETFEETIKGQREECRQEVGRIVAAYASHQKAGE